MKEKDNQIVKKEIPQEKPIVQPRPQHNSPSNP